MIVSDYTGKEAAPAADRVYMKILVLSDVESRFLWDHYKEGMLEPYSLILSCGDLKPEYLSFLATFTKAPVLYVHGNHDERYDRRPPEGCFCIDDRLVEFGGVRILGLGGSMRYRPGNYQYTEKDMVRRIMRLRGKLHRAQGFDILLSHAPAYRLGDGTDLCHQGFECFRELMDRYHPAYMLHGHMHADYNYNFKRELTYGTTQVINCYEKYELEIPDRPVPDRPFHPGKFMRLDFTKA